MPPQILRDYQERALASCLEAWRGGARTLLGVLPAGGGKTSIFTSLIAQLAQAGQPSLILVHRRELASQAANRLREFGVDHGFILAGEPSRRYAPVQIASVQTLIRRAHPPAALVVADEAHLSTANTWSTILKSYPQARILGCTATPFRLSGKPLAGAYDDLIVFATPRELREQGYLCNYVGFSYKTPDLSEVKTVAGEYNEKQSAAVMSGSAVVDSAVEEWGKHARDLSTIVFAVNVEHSKQLTARFRAAGAQAEHLDGSMSLDVRRAILRRVDSGQTQVLVNCNLLTEGVDIPRLKCCVLMAPTKSLARYIQRVGRVRRPWNGLTARIHDHAFTLRLHGLPDDDRDYTLNAAPEKPPSLSTCEVCFAVFSGSQCPACAHENAPKPQGEREIQTVAEAEQFTFESGGEAAPVVRPERPVPIRWNDVGRMIEGVFQKRWDEATSYGKQRFYLISGEKRDYSLPGTTMLNALMAKVPTGSKVAVTYTGEKSLGGGKARKEFKVEVDDGEDAEEDPRKEEARRLYVEEGKCLKDVASIVGASTSTLHKWGKNGGWLRSQSESRIIDLTGQTFGRLTVLARSDKKAYKRTYWHCRCGCGTEIVTLASNLTCGVAKSCGCLNREVAAKQMRALRAAQKAANEV